jgi:predicted translin family RNA/ssDNA-binding protein
VEEYIEAKLFTAWLSNHTASKPNEKINEISEDNDGKTTSTTTTNNNDDNNHIKKNSDMGPLLKYNEFDVTFDIAVEEFLGGLCDLTGEIGCYAVARGMVRDVHYAAKQCLLTNQNILTSTQVLPIKRIPNNVYKKMDAAKLCATKLQRMLYEISLSEATGGRHIHTDVNGTLIMTMRVLDQ